jgi:hypothetical protein
MIAESRRRERSPKKTEAINGSNCVLFAGCCDLFAKERRKSCINIFIKHAVWRIKKHLGVRLPIALN